MADDQTPVTWRKSTYSNDTGACVEVAKLDTGVALLRDSKNAAGPVLSFTANEWAVFTAGVRTGEFG